MVMAPGYDKSLLKAMRYARKQMKVLMNNNYYSSALSFAF
jgi:hypothetical protein